MSFLGISCGVRCSQKFGDLTGTFPIVSLTCAVSPIMTVLRNARIETVLMFAQSVYLMFSSVYVCKETVEHLLLSAGEGHHHHAGDEESDILGCVFHDSCQVSFD